MRLIQIKYMSLAAFSVLMNLTAYISCHAEDLRTSYIMSVLGKNPKLVDLFSFQDGVFLTKADYIKIRIFNPPSESTSLFTMSKIVDFANGSGMHYGLWRKNDGMKATEIFVFDDLYNSDNSFKRDVFSKYGVDLDANRSYDANGPNCLTVRIVNNGRIDQSINFVDNKLNDIQMRDCILRDIIYSFGLPLKVLHPNTQDETVRIDGFVEELGPFLLSRRDICVRNTKETIDYACFK